MYEEFYGFTASPFRLTPDSRFYFISEGQRKAMSYLQYGLYQGEGFIVITGAVGMGKSMLIGELFAQLEGEQIIAAQIGTTQVEADDALRLICDSFGVERENDEKATLLGALEQFLITQYEVGRRVLLVVDEAQNLPMRTLEELRMLSNFAIAGQPLFQCFFVGQPQFLATLAHPDLAQLQQRVIASYKLEALSEEETREYIEHRLTAVGWQGVPALADDVFAKIYTETKGAPRRINTLTNRVLLMAALDEAMEIDGSVVDGVIEDLKGEAVSPITDANEGSGIYANYSAAEAEAGGTIPASATLRLRELSRDFAPHMATPTTEKVINALTDRIERMEETLLQHENALRELLAIAMEERGIRDEDTGDEVGQAAE
ncbi:MAG: XrtA-associated ATPase [Neomegalonema sp.]|nr:XrtA-associated ATPase [Neomegalonema sp.]